LGCSYKKKKVKNARDGDVVFEELLAEVRGLRADFRKVLDVMASGSEQMARIGTAWWNRELAREHVREHVAVVLKSQPDRSPVVVVEKTTRVEGMIEEESGEEETPQEDMAVNPVAGPVAGPSHLA
jgi:hypothetical protein